MANPYRPLEVVIESARDLKDVNHIWRMQTYADVYMWDIKKNLRSRREKSSIDKDGGSDPKWNFKVKFNIDMAMAQENPYALVVKLRSFRLHHGARNKDIGEVRVLIQELLDGAKKNERSMRRRVSTFPDGSSGTVLGQGELTFSYEFKEPTADNPTLLNIAKKKSRGEVIRKLAKSIVPVAVSGLISGLTGVFVNGAS